MVQYTNFKGNDNALFPKLGYVLFFYIPHIKTCRCYTYSVINKEKNQNKLKFHHCRQNTKMAHESHPLVLWYPHHV